MVSVRPTIRVLKTLNAYDKLPPRTAAAYKCAVRASEPEVKMEYLREAVLHAQDELALVTYIQKRFNDGIFERHRSFSEPVFESRDTARPAWRGAVIHEEGEYAWLVHAAIHDHFHAEAKDALRGMKQSGTLGPSDLDLVLLEQQKALDGKRAFQEQALEGALLAIKVSVASGKWERTEIGSLEVVVDVETIPYGDWDVASAHHEMDMVTVRISKWQEHYSETQDFIRCLVGILNAPDDMVESYAGRDFRLQIALPRAVLIAVLDLPKSAMDPERINVPPPQYLHYSRKRDLNESFLTGKAVQAVCGKWWIPIGDEQTHQDLPVCLECEELMPVAQALRNFSARGDA